MVLHHSPSSLLTPLHPPQWLGGVGGRQEANGAGIWEEGTEAVSPGDGAVVA